MKVDIFNTDNKYNIIYADPPWSYRQSGSAKGKRGMASAHYNTMNKDAIASLPISDLCKDNAVCFMWATFPNLREALYVMEKWGFIYKTAAFVWVKRNRKSDGWYWGMGSYTRANAEICLIGVKPGTVVKDIILSHSVQQVVDTHVEKHSKKPDEVRKRIEQLISGTRIELFARECYDGWDCWGDEV